MMAECVAQGLALLRRNFWNRQKVELDREWLSPSSMASIRAWRVSSWIWGNLTAETLALESCSVISDHVIYTFYVYFLTTKPT
jgi:hypothetical protein